MQTDDVALADFDKLPDSAFISCRVLERLFGVDRTTIWRWAGQGRIPKPTKFGTRIARWHVGSVRRALAEMSEAA